MIIGLLGNARVGKDTAALHLMHRFGFVRMALADPIKNFCQEVFDFTWDQLHGESRDKPDFRYQRADGEILTPRFALQTLGTEWGRRCHPTVWVDHLVRRLKDATDDVVVTDLRFKNEVEAVRNLGGFVVRIYRLGCDGGVGIQNHASEREQGSIRDEECHFVLHNNSSLGAFHEKLDDLVTLIRHDASIYAPGQRGGR